MIRCIQFVVFVLAAVGSTCAAPTEVGYQGSLSTLDGTPLNGQVDITFAAYTAAAGGTAMWSELQTVTVTDGVYAVALGAVTPFSDDLFEQPEVWLGIKPDSEEEMTPRVRLLAVPYALHANVADSVVNASVGSWFMQSHRFNANDTPFYLLFGAGDNTPDEALALQTIPADGQITHFYACPAAAFSGDATLTLTIRHNQADSPLAVAIDATTGITCVEAVESLTVRKGDRISVKQQFSGTGNVVDRVNLGFLFQPAIATPPTEATARGPSVIAGGIESPDGLTSGIWADILGGIGYRDAEASVQFPVTRSGTIRNLIARFHSANWSGEDVPLDDPQVTLALRVNGAPTQVILHYDQSVHGNGGVVHSADAAASVSKGDLLSLKITNSSGAAVSTDLRVRLSFEVE